LDDDAVISLAGGRGIWYIFFSSERNGFYSGVGEQFCTESSLDVWECEQFVWGLGSFFNIFFDLLSSSAVICEFA
jgi:hypothetical protein